MKEAVRAARSDAGLTGKFQLKLPTTPGLYLSQSLTVSTLVGKNLQSLTVLHFFRKCAGGVQQ